MADVTELETATRSDPHTGLHTLAGDHLRLAYDKFEVVSDLSVVIIFPQFGE